MTVMRANRPAFTAGAARDPERRDASEIERLVITGSPAFAGDDS